MAGPTGDNARVLKRVDLTPALAIFHVGFDAETPLDFLPGQYATLSMKDPATSRWIRRAYSIASRPGLRYAEFLITLAPEGKFTPELWHLQVSDRLHMDEAFRGHFTLTGMPEGRDLILIATGTGIAPYMSILRHHVHLRHHPWRRCWLIHGARHAADLAYHDELMHLAAVTRWMQYLPTVSREPANSAWRGLRGRVLPVLEALPTGVLDSASSFVMLCGNPEMIDHTLAWLGHRGFHRLGRHHAGQVVTERYW